MKNIADYFQQSYETAVKNKNPSEFLFEVEDLLAELLTFLSDIYANELKDIEKAKSIMLLCKELFPWEWKIYNNLCDYYYKKLDFETAESYVRESINKCESSEPIVLYNLACILYDLGKKNESIDLYRKVLNLNPGFHVAKYNLACSLIFNENFAEGWELYEKRFLAFDHIKKIKDKYNFPYLESIKKIKKGDKILLFNEQGIGDQIFSLRYYDDLKSTGADIFFDLDEANMSLLKSTKIDNIQIFDEKLQIDYICSFMSLPHFFGEKNQKENYSSIFKRYIPPKNTIPKVGIVFAGSPNHPMDYRRSLKLSQLSSLFEINGVEYHLLQKKEYLTRTWKNKVTNLLDANFSGIDRSKELNSFKDTIKILNELDLLISVDTSMIHLAGAIGMPCFALLDKGHDYRWGKKEDNIWYESVKLIKQKKILDWKSVIDECIINLNNIFNL